MDPVLSNHQRKRENLQLWRPKKLLQRQLQLKLLPKIHNRCVHGASFDVVSREMVIIFFFCYSKVPWFFGSTSPRRIRRCSGEKGQSTMNSWERNRQNVRVYQSTIIRVCVCMCMEYHYGYMDGCILKPLVAWKIKYI